MDSLMSYGAESPGGPATTDIGNSNHNVVASIPAAPKSVVSQTKSHSSVVAAPAAMKGPSQASLERAPSSKPDLTRKTSSRSSRVTTTTLSLPDLPPGPGGAPDEKIEARINYLLAHKGNASLNERLRESREFKNPDILEKLIKFCEVNEIGSNYPPEVFNPAAFNEDEYYNKIAERQATMASTTPGTLPTFTPATSTAISSLPTTITQSGLATAPPSAAAGDGKKRSSKWDVSDTGPPTKTAKTSETIVIADDGKKPDPEKTEGVPATSRKKSEPVKESEEPSKYRQFLMQKQMSNT